MSERVRIPKQSRSIQKKEQILNTALSLFCEYDYHTVTTNQIAKNAGLSVGTLYEYFHNKEEILFEILERYFHDFGDVEELKSMFLILRDTQNKEELFYTLLKEQVASHRKSKAFNAELQSLYFSIPQVAKICDQQKGRLLQAVREGLEQIRDSLAVSDPEVATYVLVDLLGAVVDRVVFYQHSCTDEQIIREGARAAVRYLFTI